MNSPVQIERLYQDVIHQFEITYSIRHRYSLFLWFIDLLNGDYKRYSSYITQLLSELHIFTTPLTWFGINPHELERLIMVLDEIALDTAIPAEDIRIQEITGRLREVCILIYSCLNQGKAAAIHLNRLFKREMNFEAYIPDTTPEKLGSVTELLHHYLKTQRISDPDVTSADAKRINRLSKDVWYLMHRGWGSVYLPVVEEYDLYSGEVMQYGRLRKLSVELNSTSEGHDELRIHFDVYGAEDSDYIGMNEVTNASRLFVEKSFPELKNRYYKGSVTFEQKNVLHIGKSSNAAVSALWCTELVKKTRRKQSYRLKPDVCLTGDLNDEGTLKSVNESGIPFKTAAAFFSHCRYLAVPQKQQKKFQQELDKLSAIFPGKTLHVLGIHKLEDLFFDRRITEHVWQSGLHYYIKKVWNQKETVFSVFIIAALLGAIFLLAYRPFDTNPVRFGFEGTSLIVYNANDYELKRVDEGPETVAYQNTAGNIHNAPLALLYDITGDGTNDLIWAVTGSSAEKSTSVIRATSTQGDSLIWQRDLTLNYSFPRQSAYLETGLTALELGIVETAADTRVVVNSRSNVYFQSVVFTLDIKTGEILSEYIHIGHMEDMLLADVTGNGVDEIILSGINNAYWYAAIAVLDAKNAHGHSPLTEDYRPAGIEPANELTYILVPKTVIGEYVSPIEKYNQARHIHYDRYSERLWVRIGEGVRFFRNFRDNVDIILYFNHQMKPVGTGTSDAYDIVARELYEEGEIPFIPDYDYFKEFQKTILYWNGEEFVLLPIGF